MLRRTLLALTLTCTLQAQAGSFDFLPASSGAEKEFKSLMNSGNYRQALVAWHTAHGNSAFAATANGQATYSFLLYQNGLPFIGVDTLFKQTQPKSLNSQLVKVWKTELNASPLVQKGLVEATGSWSTLALSEVNRNARALWQTATQAPLNGNLEASLKALKSLKDSEQNIIGKDLVSLTYARVLFQKGDIDGALEAFNQIPKSSSIWIESVEERGWAHLRKEDYDKAVGETVTLLSPALVPLVGPESYFFANLTALKVCDYPRIFKNSELFKKRHRQRLADMQELAKNGTHKNIPALLERLEQKGVSVEGAGPLVEALPRAALRDSRFTHAIEARRQLLAETKQINDLSGTILGGAAELQRLASNAKLQADKLKLSSLQRLRTLAQAEVKEYSNILNKLHIVEASVIERLSADDNLKGQRSKLSQNEKKSADVLVFPYEGDEVWFDELDNYKARVKDCPTLKGASL